MEAMLADEKKCFAAWLLGRRAPVAGLANAAVSDRLSPLIDHVEPFWQTV